jgi:AraC-like DNA-binding protein
MPVLAEFTYPRPNDTRQLEAMFGPNLAFCSAVNALTFRRCDTELPIATSNASLQRIHNDYLERKRSEVTCTGVIERVKSVVLQHLHQTKPLTIDVISRSMGHSASQLTRSLEMAGERFQMLVDLARLQYSHHLLINTVLPLKQVSYNVGFKSQSALNKACERWFGMSPGRYRLSGGSSSGAALD